MAASDSIVFSPDIPIYRAPTNKNSSGNYIPISNDSVYTHCMNIFHTIEESGFIKRNTEGHMNEVRNNVIEIYVNVICCPSLKPSGVTNKQLTWLKGFVFVQNFTQETAMLYNELGLIQFIDQDKIYLGTLTYYENKTPKWNVDWRTIQ